MFTVSAYQVYVIVQPFGDNLSHLNSLLSTIAHEGYLYNLYT